MTLAAKVRKPEEPMTRDEAIESAIRAALRFGERINIRADHGMFPHYSGGKKPATKDLFAFSLWHLADIEAALAMPKDPAKPEGGTPCANP